MRDSSNNSGMPPPKNVGKVRIIDPRSSTKNKNNKDYSDSNSDADSDSEHSRVAMLPSHLSTIQGPFKDASKLSSAPTSASGSGTNPPPHSLAHLQYNWPGATGNGHHLEVRPMSFHELLSSQEYQIVIPLFQRRYCWTTLQIRQWYQDVAKINVGQHSTHKTMFKKHYDAGTDNLNLICIDGQQRTTTVTLLLMALRAQSRRLHGDTTLVGNIDAVLFQNSDGLAGMKRWAKYQAFQLHRNHARDKVETETTVFQMPKIEMGWFPPFQTMLVPSYIDRAAYFEILCLNYIQEALEQLQLQLKNTNDNANSTSKIKLEVSQSCQESVQFKAFHIFATELAATTSAPALNHLFRTQLHSFSMMYIELLTKDDNMQQIFLWMQEKSVFGMGRLLYNPHPGIDFAPIDLARNLVVSCVMDKPLPDQMEFFQTCWVEPLEVRFGGPENLSKILYHLVDRIDSETKTTNAAADSSGDSSTSSPRYVGDMELKLLQFKAGVPPALQAQFGNDQPMMVYGRFHSIVQHRALKLVGDPNTITQQVAESIVQEMLQEGERMKL